MNISVTCKQCGKQYDVADKLAGKRIECRLCGDAMDVSSADPSAAAEPPLTELFAQNDADENSPSGPGADSSDQADGASDRQLRIGAAILLPVVLIGLALCVATFRELDTNHLMMIAFGPFGVAFCIATLIDPDLARAAGKFGGHLPFRYKLISGLIGVAALACSLLLAKILLMP